MLRQLLTFIFTQEHIALDIPGTHFSDQLPKLGAVELESGGGEVKKMCAHMFVLAVCSPKSCRAFLFFLARYA